MRLPASGGIKTSSGNAVINESGGTVTVTNATLGSTVVGGVPVGAVMPFASVTVPTGFVICNGAEYSRTTYANLFSFVSFTDATCDTNSNTTVTMDSTSLIGVGFGVSGSGIAAGTTIASVTNGTTFVLSQAATATATNVTLTFMRWGVGTTDANFRVPNLQGAFLRGSGTGTINSRNKGGNAVGEFQEDQFQGHNHAMRIFTGTATFGPRAGDNQNYASWASSIQQPTTWSTYGDVRYGNETMPYNASVQYCIKF